MLQAEFTIKKCFVHILISYLDLSFGGFCFRMTNLTIATVITMHVTNTTTTATAPPTIGPVILDGSSSGLASVGVDVVPLGTVIMKTGYLLL